MNVSLSRRRFVRQILFAGTAPSIFVPLARAVGPARRRHIVMLHEDMEPERIAREHSLMARRMYRNALKGFAGDFSERQVDNLKRDRRVQAVELDACVRPAGDQLIPTGLLRMGMDRFPVSHINAGDERINVGVAILDTGIDMAHPDLNTSWARTASFVEDTMNGEDWTGHGTFVAGIAGALDNGFGVVGVAPGINLWNVQVLGQEESSWTNTLSGLEYVLDHADEIEVANMSLLSFGRVPISSIQTTIRRVVRKGVVVVAAVGNDAVDIAGADGIFGYNVATNNCDDYVPAALPEVMAVSGMNPTNDTFANFSNFSGIPRSTNYVSSPGGPIDVSAPASNIVSCGLNQGYAINSGGTSAAAPHVAGLVALYIAANGRAYDEAGVRKIRQAIIDASLAAQGGTSVITGDPDANHEPLALPSEAWVPQPRIVQSFRTNNSFVMKFPTVLGYNYTLEYRSALTTNAGPWNALGTVQGDGQSSQLLDSITSAAQRFYRLVRTPSP